MSKLHANHMQIACKTHANHMQIARETTSFNKSDDKSKKLEEQSKSGDARERERRQRYDG